MVAPTLRLFNSLSEQGLGGACELAAAKARFTLASTVYLETNDFIWKFLLESF